MRFTVRISITPTSSVSQQTTTEEIIKSGLKSHREGKRTRPPPSPPARPGLPAPTPRRSTRARPPPRVSRGGTLPAPPAPPTRQAAQQVAEAARGRSRPRGGCSHAPYGGRTRGDRDEHPHPQPGLGEPAPREQRRSSCPLPPGALCSHHPRRRRPAAPRSPRRRLAPPGGKGAVCRPPLQRPPSLPPPAAETAGASRGKRFGPLPIAPRLAHGTGTPARDAPRRSALRPAGRVPSPPSPPPEVRPPGLPRAPQPAREGHAAAAIPAPPAPRRRQVPGCPQPTQGGSAGRSRWPPENRVAAPADGRGAPVPHDGPHGASGAAAGPKRAAGPSLGGRDPRGSTGGGVWRLPGRRFHRVGSRTRG
ncbi:PREDICTED: basic proline-rich protein-like [Pseudopodoces humilis]|uniref:basic proline-rich protein-like n=1 Tax=Pseudopodoces humilis TaxID=181119 RepID=UPI000395C651|nr:PREDICTED: basic proline-rich protein-like [Pseudopodoces humilis]